MQRFTRFAMYLMRSFLVTGLVSLGGLCVAQEVEVEAPDTGGPDSAPGSVLAPSGYLQLIAPVQDRINLELYGFYVGDLNVPAAQVDVPIRTTKFLTITPSYLYYQVPASGLDTLAGVPEGFTDSYGEQQFRIAGTVQFSIGKLQISDRNMYVRRIRPAPTDDINRYRNRINLTYPLAIKGQIWRPFAAYEAYYDEGRNGGWNKHRVWVGVTLPLNKYVWFQPSYLWEGDRQTKDINYLMFGLIVRTR